MQLELSKGFLKKFKGRVEGYEFEVGILEDKDYRLPAVSESGLYSYKNYAGGPVLKAGREKSGMMVSDVLIENMKRLRKNILQRPFQNQSSDIVKFAQTFIRFAVGQKNVSVKRVENLLQAIVRNPILKQEYGRNRGFTADEKGFDRHLFRTGQMFQAIRAKAKRVRR